MTFALALLTAPVRLPGGLPPDVAEHRGWAVASVKITGVDKSEAGAIRKGLELSEKHTLLYQQDLERDVSRVLLYMARIGYPYSSVNVRVSPKEKKRVDLVLEIVPGPPVRVRSIEIRGVPDRILEDKALRKLPVRRNEVFADKDLESARTMVLEQLRRAGHARAEVGTSSALTDSVGVAVVIDAAPGPVYYFDRFSASGAGDDLNELALISLNIDRGERFEPKSVEDARDNLSALNLFRQIRISMDDSGADSLALSVELQERKHRTIELAGGYWSDDGFSGRARWRHRNLFRRGRGASVEASYTQYRQSGEIAAWWPALLKRRLVGAVHLGINNLNEDSFEKTAPGIGLRFSWFHTRRMASTIGYTIERASYTIKTTEAEFFEDPKGPVGYWYYRLVRDGTDDRVDPKRGSYAWVRLEYGPPGGVSNSDYVLTEFSGTMHTPLFRGVNLATNLRLGAGKPTGSSSVLLPDRRFYAGGSTSHRGFNRRRLGPLDENGLPFGGEYAMTGFVELRFPLVWKFDGAAFFDWGQIWRNRDAVTGDDIELAVGPALRLMTPVGPLRFDFGFRLTDYEPDEPDFVFHFAIGYPM